VKLCTAGLHCPMLMVRLLIILVTGIMVSIGIGTVFSLLYPRVEIDFSLAFLFILVGLLLALAVGRAWQAIWRKKT
jgi:hypothetical protein